MTAPNKWDLKTILIVFGLFGVTTFGGLLSRAQQIMGWLAGPTIESTQARGLAKVDSSQARSIEAIKDVIRRENQETRAMIDDLKITLADVPGVQEAQKRRRAREKILRDMQFRRSVAREHTNFPAFKGD